MKIVKRSNLINVAFPLGGIGTGTISLSGDGSLRQWEIVNQVNHNAFVPSSFFLLQTAKVKERNWNFKILEIDNQLPENYTPAESVSDYMIPEALFLRHQKFECFENLEFIGEYPLAKIKFFDNKIPLDITLDAWNPLIPHDLKNSSIPVIIFKFKIKNLHEKEEIIVRLGGCLLNFIGWDGISNIDLGFYPKFLSNVNEVFQTKNSTSIWMRTENELLENDLKGDICFGTIEDKCKIILDLEIEDDLPNTLEKLDSGFIESQKTRPSHHGKTWIGVLVSEFTLKPSEQKEIYFFLSWHFPNRYVNWSWGRDLYHRLGIDDKSKFWLGNYYSKFFKSSKDVFQYTIKNLEILEEKTKEFHDILFNSTVPKDIIETVSSTLSILRSPSCFLTKKGEFYSFEGCCGASTSNIETVGGCCPMNCSHVWNYPAAHVRLFPQLEKSLLNNEYLRFNEKWGIPHRLIVPTYLPQAHNVRIDTKKTPAIDGMLGCVLKTYRYLLFTNDMRWFNKVYSSLVKLMNYIFREYDPEGKGVIEGEQFNTYDISLFGKNSFIGGLYLAALKSCEKMAILKDDDTLLSDCLKRFETGKKIYDETLWNGEYWLQEYDETSKLMFQYGDGCLSDQLFGQFWADMLDLEQIFSKNKVLKTLESIMRYNFKENLKNFKQQPRVFASEWDGGLLNCTWPKGNRPKVPLLYSDEVWTGIEYEVASLMIANNLIENALKIIRAVRKRYDGNYRNPWNEIECGDHYIRALSSWRLYESSIGFFWDAINSKMKLLPIINESECQGLIITSECWGKFQILKNNEEIRVNIIPIDGTIILYEIETWNMNDNPEIEIKQLKLGEKNIIDKSFIKNESKKIIIRFKEAIEINNLQPLIIKINRKK